MKDSGLRVPKPSALVKHVADLDEKAALAIVRQSLAKGHDPVELIKECQLGMRMVGERYQQGIYHISGLIMAGAILDQVTELTKPLIREGAAEGTSKQMILGTVHGDIHNIGKNVVNLLLSCNGFTVHDLGVDVAPVHFLRETLRIEPDLLGLSGLLTSAYDAMRETIDLIHAETADWSYRLPVIIGGSQTNQQICSYVGADDWCNDASKAVDLCFRLIDGNR